MDFISPDKSPVIIEDAKLFHTLLFEEAFKSFHLFLYMAKEKFTMPQSTAGLVRYFDATKESIKLKPEHVLGICVVIIIFEIAIKFVF